MPTYEARKRAWTKYSKSERAKSNRLKHESSDKCKKTKKLWISNNLEKVRANKRKWNKTHPEHKKFLTAKRRAKKLNATPPWLNQQQSEEIYNFYKEASELTWLSESPLEVDHIIPLQGENVSGLHVPWNLQILPACMNQQKGNKVS